MGFPINEAVCFLYVKPRLLELLDLDIHEIVEAAGLAKGGVARVSHGDGAGIRIVLVHPEILRVEHEDGSMGFDELTVGTGTKAIPDLGLATFRDPSSVMNPFGVLGVLDGSGQFRVGRAACHTPAQEPQRSNCGKEGDAGSGKRDETPSYLGSNE